MSTVNGLSSNSYIYSPTINSYNNDSSLLNALTAASATSSSDLYSAGTELDQINQGIDPQVAATYTPSTTSTTATTATTASPTNSVTTTNASTIMADALKKNPFLSATVLNYNSQLSLIQSFNASSHTDPVINLCCELNFLNQGINDSQLSAVSGILAQDSASPDIAALGTELSQLNSSIAANSASNSASASNTATDTTSDSTSASSASGTPVLNYNYSPGTGITTNTSDDSSGSNLDLSL